MQRLNRTQEVVGSIPISSTNFFKSLDRLQRRAFCFSHTFSHTDFAVDFLVAPGPSLREIHGV